MSISRLALCWLVVLPLVLGGVAPAQDADGPAAVKPIDFVHEVVPILKRNCVTCHGGREAEGDFSINTRETMLSADVVDLKHPEASHLLELITSDDPDAQMPPSDRPRVPVSEVAVLRRWVEEGLPWDADFTFELEAYEPPLRPRTPDLPPAVDGRTNPIDRILDAYLAEHDVERPGPIDDATFLRRASLDLVGLLPTPERLEAFLADTSNDKRERLVDELLTDDFAYADHWLTFFNDLLRNDYSGTGFITGGRRQISKWLYESLLENEPYDQMVREIIAPPTVESQGYIDGIKWRGEVSAGQTLPIQFAQSISQSFLGINMKCASCHDSFIDRWTLKEAYGLAAIYADGPLELHRCDKPIGETAEAAWLFPEIGRLDPSASREERLKELAALMTDPQNGRFTRTIINRLWYKLMGRGIVHPLDAMQREPWNADLLDYLAVHLAEHDYDLKSTLRLIATSQAYQSQTEVVEQSTDDDYVYHGPRPRRMTAEQLLDAVWQITRAAPTTIEAPVVRIDVAPDVLAGITLQADWIWGKLTDGIAAGGEQILIRKTFNLPDAVAHGGAIATCDNGFRLFVNGREATGGDDFSKLQSVLLAPQLKKGDNELTFVASNGGSEPNPAGLYFEARLTLANGETVTIKSDESWEWNPAVPGVKEGRIGSPKEGWQPVTIVPPHAAWTEVVERDGRMFLAAVSSGNQAMPMVRAALMKNTPLMQSLGRPLREQIVSMRPTTLTTLEAIDLANEPGFAETFAIGARNLLSQPWDSTDALIDQLFRATLTRDPTDGEQAIFREALGDEPDEATLQDALWALCMLPEFLLIR